MDYKLKRVMSKIENGNIQSAHNYELVDTYYQCVIYKIDEYDDDEEPTDASYPEELLYQLPERQSGIFEAMSMLITVPLSCPRSCWRFRENFRTCPERSFVARRVRSTVARLSSASCQQ